MHSSHPHHGSISIALTSINDLPIIDINYFATSANHNIAVQGLKNVLALAASDTFWPMFLGSGVRQGYAPTEHVYQHQHAWVCVQCHHDSIVYI